MTNENKAGKTNILIMDDTHKLKPSNFELLRQLLNFETHTEKMLQIILFGENHLASKIDAQPALKDRIVIFGALTPLTYDEAVKLIDFRWKVAGGANLPFTQDALEAIYVYSKGLPRKISKLCTNALIRAASYQVTSIDKTIIEYVAKEVRLDDDGQETVKKVGRPKKVQKKDEDIR